MATKSNQLSVAHKAKFSSKEMEALLMGVEQPHALPLEEAIIGSVMLDKTAYNTISNIISAKVFYEPKHQYIWRAFESLKEEGAPIDLLTVNEKLKKHKRLEAAGGSYYLVEMTNRVASTANLEYHAMIVYQKYLSREAINKCSNMLKRLYEDKHDVFEMRNDIADDMRVMPPTSFFKVSSFTSDIEEGKNAPELLKLCGTLWNKTEVGFLFAPPGTGKTILAIQLANALSKGIDVIPGKLTNECPPQKVLYIDFELTQRNLADRYTNKETKKSYDFDDEMLKRVSINIDFLDFDKRLDRIAQDQIEQLILIEKPEVLIVDNITFLTNEGTHDSEVAVRIMKKLSFYKNRYNLSVLVLAHTTKAANSPFLPLEIGQMAGSGQLQNFADAIFGLKKSGNDKSFIYIKQFKDRSEPMKYEDDNVMVMEVEKTGENLSLLAFEYAQETPERAQIKTYEDDDETLDLILSKAVKMLADREVTGMRPLVEAIGWKKSRNNLATQIKKYVDMTEEYYMNENGKVCYTAKPF